MGGTIGGPYTGTPIILKTNDGGVTWYQVFTDPFAKTSNIFFLNHNIGFAIGDVIWYSNNLLRTEDGGETWDAYSTSLGRWMLNDLCMSENGVGLLIGDHGQVYKSEDYGMSWEKDYSNLMLEDVVSDAEIITDSIIVAVTTGESGTGGITGGRIIRSDDAGATWVGVAPASCRSLSFINDSVGYAGGRTNYSKLNYLKTTDRGLSWQEYQKPNIELETRSICFIDEKTGFIGGGSYFVAELYKTSDGGEKWNPIKSTALDHFVEINDIEFKNELNGYIVGFTFESGNIVKTNDGGETWSVEHLPFNFYELKGVYFYNSEVGFIYGYNVIIKTSDGGQSWDTTTISLPGDRYYNFVHLPTLETGYATGENVVFKSDDGGDTWDPLEPVGGSVLNTVNFFTEDLGIVMGNKGIIYRTTTGGTVFTPEISYNSEKKNNWKCYPNPFSQDINFLSIKMDIENAKLKIYDLSGNLVYNRNTLINNKSIFWNGKTDNQEIVPSGIYICEIHYDHSKQTLKIIKL